MVTIIKLYILFICINFGWGMLATGLVEASEGTVIPDPVDLAYKNGNCDGLGEPACQLTQGCPADGVDFNEAIHHKLCLVGIQTPDALQFDAKSQSPDITNTVTTGKVFRNVTSTDGTIYQVITSDSGNKTGIDSSISTLTGGFGDEFFSFLDSSGRVIGFGAKLFLDTFTGGFILDVLGTGIVGVDFPPMFLDGIKILIGVAIASYFGYLFIGKPLID